MTTLEVITPRSLRLAEIFTVLLGLGLSTVAISARTYMKVRVLRQFLSEDYFSVAAYCGLLAYLAVAIVIGKNSGGLEHKAYLSMVESILYEPVIVLVKTSILLQYVTVFVVHRRSFFHGLIHVIIWANAIFYIIITFLFIFRCEPRRKLWIPQTPGVCHNAHGRGVLSGSANIVTDFLILILPLPVLLRLQMPSKKKYRLLCVFGFGFFACVASIVRLVYSLRLNSKNPIAYQLNVNRQGLLAFAEIAIGIIVGCMPELHKFCKHVSASAKTFSFKFPYISSRGGSSNGGSGGGRSSWRRKFFARSSSSAPDAHPSPRKLSGSISSSGGSSAPPHIKTLNMTRASFTLGEPENITPIPTPMPTPPPPPPPSGPTQTEKRESGLSEGIRNPWSGSEATIEIHGASLNDENHPSSEKIHDEESGGNSFPSTWEPSYGDGERVGEGDGEGYGSRREGNETVRAQYERFRHSRC